LQLQINRPLIQNRLVREISKMSLSRPGLAACRAV